MESVIYGIYLGGGLFAILWVARYFLGFTILPFFLVVIIGAFIGTIIGSVGGFLYGIILYSNSEKEINTETVYYLENLQDNTSTNGNLFLGMGNINGSMQYAFYHKKIHPITQEETYKLVLLNYSQAEISYSEEKPRVDKIKYIVKDKRKREFAIDLRSDRYIIYVPPKSIVENYTLDAK